MIAMSNGHTGIVKILIEAGADLEATGVVGYSARMFDTADTRKPFFDESAACKLMAPALHAAAAIGHNEIARMLLKAGANVDAIGRYTTGDVVTPLFVASEAGCLSIVYMLLAGGANIRKISPGQRNSLIAAAENGHGEVVTALIEAGAEVNARSDGVSALGVVAAKGHVHIVETLVRHGVYIDFDDYYGHTALMIAAAEGHAEVVQTFIDEAGGQLSAIPGFEQAIDLATKEGHNHIEQMLLDRFIDSSLQ